MRAMDRKHATLGTLLRALLDQLDPAVELAYKRIDLDYRPRFTPVIRALLKYGPVRIKDIADDCGLSHAALSQTTTAMIKDGWLVADQGADGRERILRLTEAAQAHIPALERQWRATALAAEGLSKDIGVSLEQVLSSALVALEQRSFDERLIIAQRALGGKRARQ